jgi:hypothetical protein
MLKDVRTAVDRLAQRVDGLERSMGTFASAVQALSPQGMLAVRALGDIRKKRGELGLFIS